jgi:hypothetical protein
VTAHTQISQYAIYGRNSMKSKKSSYMPKVVRDEYESLILQDISLRVPILIKTV